MSICLTKEELKSLTNKTRTHAQIAVLNQMRIDHRVRPDGSILVYRHTIGLPLDKSDKKTEPNFEALFNG